MDEGTGSSLHSLSPACRCSSARKIKRLKREREFVLPTQKTLLGSSPPQGLGRFPPALASPRPSPHPKGPCPQAGFPPPPQSAL